MMTGEKSLEAGIKGRVSKIYNFEKMAKNEKSNKFIRG